MGCPSAACIVSIPIGGVQVLRYILKRILMLIPILIGVILIVFILMQLTPGDAAQTILGAQASQEAIDNLRQEMGLNDPLPVQFGRYLLGIVRLDFGASLKDGTPVLTKLMAALPYTIELTIAAIILALCVGVPLGIVSATHQYSIFDKLATVFALFSYSTPNFWLSIMLILAFAVNLRWFPVSGSGGIEYLVLPMIALGTQTAGVFARMTRSSMLEAMNQDYIRTLRAKGLAERSIVYKHALKNALIPIITIVGLQLGVLLGGALLTETVFAWPGIGRLMIDSIRSKDTNVVQGGVIMTASMFIIINLIVDLIYAYADPRVKAEYKR